MKRNLKLFAVVVLSVLAALVLKSNRGHGQNTAVSAVSPPVIVAQRVFKNQTGTIPVTTLFTPTTTGTYRVSVYVDSTNLSQQAMTVTGYWTDDFSTYQAQIVVSGNENGAAEEGWGQNLIVDLAGSPIQLGAVYTTGVGEYNLYVVVERI